MGIDLCFVKTFLVVFFALVASVSSSGGIYNVNDYGAIGDGKTESSKAFEAAWDAACAVEGRGELLIPEEEFLVGPTMFKGPCKGFMVVQLKGKLLADTDLSAYKQGWIEFQYIDGLIITGGGTIHGQGASAWPYNTCSKSPKCMRLPLSMGFSFVNNASISEITSIDSKQVHINVFSCMDVEFNSIRIVAPADSPNKDGIHMGISSNINILNSVIGTGDDCISVSPGTINVTVANILCGPGHGISVSSLGGTANEKDVIGFTAKNCTFNSTTNGVRIKTWQSSPTASKASSFLFEDIIMNNVYYPIIIDQKYCPSGHCNGKSPSLVKINDVSFRNI